MHNILIMDRWRYNGFRHNPMGVIMLLDFFAIREDDGHYFIMKNRNDPLMNNDVNVTVTKEYLDRILDHYR